MNPHLWPLLAMLPGLFILLAFFICSEDFRNTVYAFGFFVLVVAILLGFVWGTSSLLIEASL